MDENTDSPLSISPRSLSDLNIPQDVLYLMGERKISVDDPFLIFNWDDEACNHFVELLRNHHNTNRVNPPNAFDRFIQQPNIKNLQRSLIQHLHQSCPTAHNIRNNLGFGCLGAESEQIVLSIAYLSMHPWVLNVSNMGQDSARPLFELNKIISLAGRGAYDRIVFPMDATFFGDPVENLGV